VNAAGVNPYDTYMRSGAYGSGNPALPFVPGSDATGVVESVGAEVDLTLGQRVYTTGTITGAYAELALCKRSQVHLLPERVSYAQGAGTCVPYATAYPASPGAKSRCFAILWSTCILPAMPLRARPGDADDASREVLRDRQRRRV
jgi:NADPH:quinone reductase-like Zn-dependent oxidoreductase